MGKIETGHGEVSYIGSINASSKLAKGDKLGVKTYGVYLAPASSSGYNVCPSATKGCIAACLNMSGRSKMGNRNQIARVRKTKMYFEKTEEFVTQVRKEISRHYKNAQKKNFEFTVRLNCTSDLNITNLNGIERHNNLYSTKQGANLLNDFPNIQFYDYAKCKEHLELANRYTNYNLTYSHNGMQGDWKICESFLKANQNVSAVFYPKVPTEYKGFKVIDGDVTDLRYLDEKGCIVGLKYKSVKGETKEGITNNNFIIKT